jgi:hypothetical protein
MRNLCGTQDLIMPLGFISRDDDEHRAGASDKSREIQTAEFSRILAVCEGLHRQIQKYAYVLEFLDPLNRNADEEVGNVVLALSYADTPQEYLEALTSEARRLMRAVAGANRGQAGAGAVKLPSRAHHLAAGAKRYFPALLWGLCVFFAFLIA